MTASAAGVPAVCDHCDWRGHVPGLFGGNARDLTLVGNQTNCPSCGEWARIVDGSYELIDSTFQMTSGSVSAWREFAEIMSAERWTRQRAEMVARALRSAVDGRKPDFVAEQVKRIDPQLGTWLMEKLRDPAAGPIISILMGFLTLAIAAGLFDGDERPDPNVIIQYVEECQEDPGRMPEPTPPDDVAARSADGKGRAQEERDRQDKEGES